MKPDELAARGVRAEKQRRNALAYHEQQAEAEARAELAVTALHDAYANQLAACAEWEVEMSKARGVNKHKVAAARYAGHYSAMNDLAKRIASLEAAALKGETT